MAFQNGLRPAKELASNRPHGDRLKYLGGCRCVPCRAANSRYETERAAARRRGEWNGLIDASPVRRHLIKLSRREIGRKTVADITGVMLLQPSTLFAADSEDPGNERQERSSRSRPTPWSRTPNVSPAEPTWRLIDWLLKQGFYEGRDRQPTRVQEPFFAARKGIDHSPQRDEDRAVLSANSSRRR